MTPALPASLAALLLLAGMLPTACGREPATAGTVPASLETPADASPEAAPPSPSEPPANPASNPSSNRGPLTTPDAEKLVVLRESDAGLPVIAIEVVGERYEVELAATHASRMRGMGGRKRFPKGTGMLFVHPDDGYRNYWMKDCFVPMDVAFLDREGRILAMHRMAIEPPRAANESPSAYSARLKRYPSRRQARYALEVPYGDLKRLKLRVGQTLPLPRAPLDELAAREPIAPGR